MHEDVAARHGPRRTRVRLVLPGVGEVMSRPVVSVSERARLSDALAVMVGTRLRHLVVTDPAGRCVGMLSDRQLVAVWAKDPSALNALRVRDILLGVAAAVPQDASVAQVAGLMCTAEVDAVAVVNTQGYPVGVVTGSDLAAVIARRR